MQRRASIPARARKDLGDERRAESHGWLGEVRRTETPESRSSYRSDDSSNTRGGVQVIASQSKFGPEQNGNRRFRTWHASSSQRVRRTLPAPQPDRERAPHAQRALRRDVAAHPARHLAADREPEPTPLHARRRGCSRPARTARTLRPADSAGMPTPVSPTLSSTMSSRSGATLASTITEPPGGVNLLAFERRFSRICSTFSRSTCAFSSRRHVDLVAESARGELRLDHRQRGHARCR